MLMENAKKNCELSAVDLFPVLEGCLILTNNGRGTIWSKAGRQGEDEKSSEFLFFFYFCELES